MDKELTQKCFNEGIERYPFWAERKRELKELLSKIEREVQDLEDAAQNNVEISKETTQKTKAIWCLSGSGSYLEPLISAPSDIPLKSSLWAHGTDKKRLDYCAQLLHDLKNKGGNPIFVYNGVEEQNEVLRKIASKNLGLNKNEFFIPEGNNTKTIDQVMNLTFPKQLKLEKLDIVGVVSHAAHLSRVMRMVEKFRPFPKNVDIMLYPLVFKNSRDEDRFVFSEIMGILGYISRGEISKNAYHYKLKGGANRGGIRVAKINKNDLMDVYNLSNQEDVRAASFNSAKIELKDHEKWFSEKLKDKNTVWLKAVVGQSLAGQIRLDIENKKALIGVSVGSEYRGRGVASILLQSVITRAKKKKIKFIEAFIKSINSPSIGLFKKHGFVYDDDVQISGSPAKRFIYRF